jgi:hypothetical protein
MRLYYFNGDENNFGDDLNSWIWELIPGVFDGDVSHLCLGIGTIINHRLPPAKFYTVLGSGCGYGELPTIDNSWSFCFVRGPHTATKLGLDMKLAVTDPACMLPVVRPQDYRPQSGVVSFIPHVDTAASGPWETVCDLAGLNYIDPRWPLMRILPELMRSERVLTEAMHGAILADSFGVPWKAITTRSGILQFKWEDWTSSMNLNYQSLSVPPVSNSIFRDGIFKGTKISVKSSLKSLGIWKSTWTDVPPPTSSRAEFQLAAKSLRSAADSPNYLLSDRHLLAARQGTIIEYLEQFRKLHSKKPLGLRA